MDDTICAISSALGIGAISIIRVSGPKAITIVNKIFKGKDLTKVPDHSVNYGHILSTKKIIDEVLVIIMKKPKTYTTEDTVEINCHGGIAVTQKILEILLENGCRLADPGEFTKRAFLNGRIDLLEAEAVQDLLMSETENARKLYINQIEGKVSKKVKLVRKKILKLLANIEVNLDYPEYEDAIEITGKYMQEKLKEIRQDLQNLINNTENGRIIKSGISVALVGKPNVGKSSILNCLLDEEKAIVTNIAGTTRDLVEGSFLLNGIKINLIDTAGIRATKNKIEQLGVKKTEQLLEKMDLIILVLDNNNKLTTEDKKLLKKLKNKKKIIFVNKNDLRKNVNLKEIDEEVIYGNTKKENGLDALLTKIEEMFNLEKINTQDPTYLSNTRQKSLVKEAYKCIDNCLGSIKFEYTIDFLASDIKKAWDLLGEIVGETYNDELLDELFSNFCLGK
ncbi:MAG TPA: tRNA uridine-5-carboxymethylaminomethyl(34) synthesis GTPase MnmE [Bacilli bacterium]|nr:tRNA uridine-5-carboxymethylaminomethyl(34) synthesis GTPase MnmE [Bacilli bacterium]